MLPSVLFFVHAFIPFFNPLEPQFSDEYAGAHGGRHGQDGVQKLDVSLIKALLDGPEVARYCPLQPRRSLTSRTVN
ncbi:MAG: hypothetical protein LC751_08280 [Actinobacteria bacterium]|nr:hypothetical protein [Actinomycetota bacterium]